MGIWDILPDGDTFRSFRILDLPPGKVLDITQAFRSGGPLGGSWTPMRVTLFQDEGESKKPVGDFPSLGGSAPLAVSAHALELLQPLIQNNVEVLDLITDIGKFFVLNVLAFDCLDHSKSTFKRFSDGEIMRVEVYAFKPGSLKSKHIFRIPEIWSHTFVDDVFKQAVEENGLKGLFFSRIPETNATAG